MIRSVGLARDVLTPTILERRILARGTTAQEPGTGIEPIVEHVLSRPEFDILYQNRVRELRDLLLNHEQIFLMLEEYANVIDSPAGGHTFTMADRFMWVANANLAVAVHGPGLCPASIAAAVRSAV